MKIKVLNLKIQHKLRCKNCIKIKDNNNNFKLNFKIRSQIKSIKVKNFIK